MPAAVLATNRPLTGLPCRRALNSSDLNIFEAALAQTLQPYGVVPAYISIGVPTPVTGRRLLQASCCSHAERCGAAAELWRGTERLPVIAVPFMPSPLTGHSMATNTV